jgi:hypothetical protein
MFVQGRVAVTANGVIEERLITPEMDVIFIRAKMDYGTTQRVIGAATKVAVQSGRRKATRTKAKDNGIAMDVGAFQVALLVHNVLEWQGPSFAGVPCVAANIERLDPSEALVQRTLTEIGERNTHLLGGGAEDDEGDDEAADPNVLEGQPLAALSHPAA